MEDLNGAQSREHKGMKNEATYSKKATGPLAPSRALFSTFGNTRKVSIFRALGIIFAMASGAMYPCMAFYVTKSFENIGTQVTDENYLSNVIHMVYTFLVLGSIGFFFLVLQSTFLEISASEATQDLKIQWFNALLRQDMAYFDINDISAQATVISSNAARFKKGIGRKLGEGVQFTCTLIGGFIYAFYVSWRVSLVILVAVPFMSAAAIFMMSVTTKHTERTGKNYATTGGIVYTTISSIRTVFALNAPELMIEKFKAATMKACDSAVGFNALVGLGTGSMMGSFLVSYIVVTLYGSFLLYSQVQKFGCDPSNTLKYASAFDNVESCSTVGADIFGALLGISFGAMGMAQISTAVEAFIGSRASAYPALEAINRKFDPNESETLERVEAPLSEEMTVSTATRSDIPLPKYVIDATSDYGQKPKLIKGDISFNNVSFSYPTRKGQMIFNGLSLNIRAGSTVAIVGPSGCGKSSIISLLERFYDVNAGSITLDGIDIRDINVQWLREHIGLVSQEPVLFARSIKENIAYGLPGATDEDIIRVCKSANAHEFISKFANGYNTQVGDKGTQLSGGQKQRIAIARVLLRNPKILLLDEATSALDNESEYLVQEAIDSLLGRGNHTTIVVAHRLSTIRNADAIAVIKDGRIAEIGTHDELLNRGKSEYSKLVSTQIVDRDNIHKDDANSTAEPLIINDSGDMKTPQIEFKDVHFHYPTRPSNAIFKGLNLKINQGETIAIVGASGCGKSTVVQLLERFYDPNSGTISYEGHDLKELNIKWYRDQIGLVSQEPTLFNTTIRENIKYGLPGATQDQIEEVAIKASAHEFIMSFPLGYDTDVGESAIQISGGQKQRIAIARAILKKPKILLLDEATSALDTESEQAVQRAIDSLMEAKNQTIVVIAHRLSTIRNADRIAVVADGVVKEVGTHDQLQSIENGYYKRLVNFDNMSRIDKKMIIHSKVKAVEDDYKETSCSLAREEVEHEDQKMKEKAYRIRAKRLSDPDRLYFLIGMLGALLAGVVFPGWGVVLAYMIELLFHPVFPCDEFNFNTSDPFGIELNPFDGFKSCEDYFDNEAEWIRGYSYNITYAWLGLIASSMIGNVLLYYGFGTATERMNKRVRDAIFVALMKQDVEYYDNHSVGRLSTQIEEDASMIHSFSGEPIRTFVMSISSIVVGLIISFSLMWPFALMIFAILPPMGFGAYLGMQVYTGEDEGSEVQKENKDASGGIVVETLLNIRTVVSLSIEKMRSGEYITALKREDPSSVKTNLIKGLATGLSFLIHFWSLGFMFYWGGYLISNYPNTYSFRGYLISMFSLLYSLSGLSVALMGTTDKKKAKIASERTFSLLDRVSKINSLSDEGKEFDV